MKGLEIIEEIPIIVTPAWTFIVMICGVFLILVPTYFTYKKTNDYEKALKTEVIYCVIYMAILLFVMLQMLVNGAFDKPTGEYKYKVNITDECGFNEFNNAYEIIKENEDGTYVIKEK